MCKHMAVFNSFTKSHLVKSVTIIFKLKILLKYIILILYIRKNISDVLTSYRELLFVHLNIPAETSS